MRKLTLLLLLLLANVLAISAQNTIESAIELVEGVNTVDSLKMGNPERWYKATAKAQQRTKILFTGYPVMQAYVGSDLGESLGIDNPIDYINLGDEKEIYIRMQSTNEQKLTATVSYQAPVADLSSFGELAFSVAKNGDVEENSNVTVSFPQHVGGLDEDSVTLNYYIFAVKGGSPEGAPVNLGGKTVAKGTLGNGVPVAMEGLTIGKKYRLSVQSLQSGNHYAPGYDEQSIVNNYVDFYYVEATPQQNKLISTVKTHRYDTHGPENVISFWLGATEDTEISVDFGNGPQTYTIKANYSVGEGDEDSDEESVLVGGTEIKGSVTADGIIQIYGDASKIDYVNIHGSEIYDIDLSQFVNISMLELSHNELQTLTLDNLPYMEFLRLNDNPFDQGLYLGEMIRLKYLNVNQMGEHALDHSNGVIDLTKYKALFFFTAWDSHCLKQIDPSQCKYLTQLSVDNSGVASLDVTKNENLLILNIGDTPINSIDLSKNTKLVEFYASNEGQWNPEYKFSSIDLSNNPLLQRIFLDGNRLTSLDVSKQWNLISLYAANNNLTSIKGIDINEPADQRPIELAYLDLSGNRFTFATLPEVDPMTYFYYDLQQDIHIDKEQCVGLAIDLSDLACRKGTTTKAFPYTITREGIEDPVMLTEGVDFTIETDEENSKFFITFLKEQTDSVGIALLNDVYDGVTLYTTNCLVRSAADYGKPVQLFALAPAAPGELTFKVTTRKDEDLTLDLGDGATTTIHTKAMEPTTITCTANSVVTVKGSVAASVYGITAYGMALSSVDLSRLDDLAELILVDCGMSNINLEWNHALHYLDLSDNNLTTLDLTGHNDAFHKNVLSHIRAERNGMKTFVPGLAQLAVKTIELAENELTEFETTDFENLTLLDLSNNKLAELTFTDCEALEVLNVSHNELKSLDLSTCTALKDMDATNNYMRFSTMPKANEGFVMAPQNAVKIAAKASTCDLSSEAMIDDVATTYAWRDEADGSLLTEGTDYTISGGYTSFLAPAVGRTVHCEMSNALYPEFSGEKVLTTTPIFVMGEPKYEIASFTTPVGEQPIGLSLASTVPDTYVYIDWGNGQYAEYPLQTTYTLFSGSQSIAGSAVKVYSNEAPHGNIGVFSISGVTMSDIDVSKMTELYCLTVDGASLSSIDLSKNTKLQELSLEKNKFTTIDLSALKNLRMLALTNNDMESFTLAEGNNIQWFYGARNKFTNIDMHQLSNAYNVDLTGNLLETLDITPAQDLGQLFVANNQLHSLDITQNAALTALDISYNNFDFSTLPNPEHFTNSRNFRYGDQEPLHIECVDGKIDLTAQASAWGEPSQIYFFDNYVDVYEDEEGNLTFDAGEFVEGQDFVNNNGLISFFENQPRVVGAIMNPLYPDLILYTERIAVTADPTAINEVSGTSSKRNSGIYNLLGQKLNKAQTGINIVEGKKVITK